MEEENSIVAMAEEDETMTSATTLVDEETAVAKERPPPRLMITKMVSYSFLQHFPPPIHLILFQPDTPTYTCLLLHVSIYQGT
jgi:hypothetical protein